MAQSDLTPASEVAFDDIQGLVRFGHGHLAEAAFLLLRIEDPRAARAWLAAAPVTSATDANPLPDTASPLWAWGGPGHEPDVLVMLYAIAGGIAAWTEAVKGATWDTAFSTVAALPTKRLGDTGDGFSREPFGFVDGISQPELDWQQERRTGVTELTYGNSVALGEFLLGYRNEYGNFTDRPLLDPVTDPHNLLSRAADNPTKCDLGRNGTYLVLRDLQQDVRTFWQYLERQANVTGATRQRLAEAMVRFGPILTARHARSAPISAAPTRATPIWRTAPPACSRAWPARSATARGMPATI